MTDLSPVDAMTKPRSVFFQKGDERIIIWTNDKRWTVTDMAAGTGTKCYTKQLAMALFASLMAEGYEATIHD